MSISTQDINYVKDHIRLVPDFPKEGIQFVDITTTLQMRSLPQGKKILPITLTVWS